MNNLSKFNECAKTLAVALDEANDGEHHFSKEIRRFLERKQSSYRMILLKFKMMIDHDDGLLNSIDNVLIQLCYRAEQPEHEHERVKLCIELITAKTEFVKQLFLLPNSNIIGFENV